MKQQVEINGHGDDAQGTAVAVAKGSRNDMAKAYWREWAEREQEMDLLRNRIDELNRDLEKEQAICKAFEVDCELMKKRAQVFEDERDEAVVERVRLTTIFSTMQRLMSQAGVEVEGQPPVKGHVPLPK